MHETTPGADVRSFLLYFPSLIGFFIAAIAVICTIRLATAVAIAPIAKVTELHCLL